MIDGRGVAENPTLAVVARAGRAITSGFAEPADDAYAESFVFHYFNARLPELSGDYRGYDGLRSLFGKLHSTSGGTFRVEPVSRTAFGDELVVVHAKISLKHSGTDLEIDSLVVWRVVDGRVAEAWDIPAVNTPRFVGGGSA